MRWLALNGSPRGDSSNTRILLEAIRSGMARELAAAGELDFEEIYLNRTGDHDVVVARVAEADGLLLAYPLYTDSMPGIVVQFLETLDRAATIHAPLPAAFLVHSGFPEGVHTAHLADVHRRLCDRLSLRYAGTIRKPGSEGVRLMPRFMLRTLRATLADAGAALAGGGSVEDADIGRLVRFERFGPARRLFFRVESQLGMTDIYWNQMLKKHGALENRFDAPYGPPFGPSSSEG